MFAQWRRKPLSISHSNHSRTLRPWIIPIVPPLLRFSRQGSSESHDQRRLPGCLDYSHHNRHCTIRVARCSFCNAPGFVLSAIVDQFGTWSVSTLSTGNLLLYRNKGRLSPINCQCLILRSITYYSVFKSAL